MEIKLQKAWGEILQTEMDTVLCELLYFSNPFLLSAREKITIILKQPST